ncbi:hypothetical protein [Novosphingobium sp.]|uniref:hypothetical protein n=1 Tax=Novosphingobium sp. TaxID=1874826 RepID=UPI0026109806|nr:hypothetical protein [Novosphingobium sp.]
MNDRIEALRQAARAEAAEHSDRLAKAMMIGGDTRPVSRGRAAAAYGQTACPRCGVRSGVGCKHRPAGDTSTKLSSFDRRRGLA